MILVAFDSQINTYTYVFMPFLHEMYFLRYLGLLILSKPPPMSKSPLLTVTNIIKRWDFNFNNRS